MKPENALGNTTPQIDLLYLLGALDDKTCKAMKGLAGIRNYFAHHTNPSFNSQDEDFVSRSIKRLTLHEGRTYYPHRLWGPDTTIPLEPVNTRRDQFIVNLKLALVFLMRDRVSHAAHSNVPAVAKRKCSGNGPIVLPSRTHSSIYSHRPNFLIGAKISCHIAKQPWPSRGVSQFRARHRCYLLRCVRPLWPMTSDGALRRYFRNWGLSGLCADCREVCGCNLVTPRLSAAAHAAAPAALRRWRRCAALRRA